MNHFMGKCSGEASREKRPEQPTNGVRREEATAGVERAKEMRLQGTALLCWALGAEGMPLGHARHLLIYDPSGMHLAILLMVS